MSSYTPPVNLQPVYLAHVQSIVSTPTAWSVVVKDAHGAMHLNHISIPRTATRSSVMKQLKGLAETHFQGWKLILLLKNRIIEVAELASVSTLAIK